MSAMLCEASRLRSASSRELPMASATGSDQAATAGRSSSGTSRRSQMMVSGRGLARSATMSIRPSGAAAVMIRSTASKTRVRSAATARGANALLIRARSRGCSGASL